jgi:hypothetical protein
MAGYSGTPLWKKLGYRDGLSAYIEGAPDAYRALLTLPRDVGVTWSARLSAGAPFVHVFSTRKAELGRRLAKVAGKMGRDGVVWVSWPKRTSGVATDITEDTIRELAFPLGLVDIKVCAVDEIWSGLKLMIRRELR